MRGRRSHAGRGITPGTGTGDPTLERIEAARQTVPGQGRSVGGLEPADHGVDQIAPAVADQAPAPGGADREAKAEAGKPG